MTDRFLGQITQLVAIARYCWRDSRVSAWARLLVWLAPVYLACPCDLHPDWLPNGLADDLCIVPLLLLAACAIIPKAVFRDARSAALLRKKAVVLGMLYVSAAGVIPVPAAPSQHPHAAAFCRSERGPSLRLLPPSATRSERARVEKTAPAYELVHRHDNKFWGSGYLSDSFSRRATIIGIANGHGSPACGSGPSLLLAMRGGQYQLYAAEEAAAVVQAHEPAYSFAMPLSSSGIFVGTDTGHPAAMPKGGLS